MPEIRNSLFLDLTSYGTTTLTGTRRVAQPETITIGDGAVIGANDHAF